MVTVIYSTLRMLVCSLAALTIMGQASPPTTNLSKPLYPPELTAEISKMNVALRQLYLVTPRGSAVRREQEIWSERNKFYPALAKQMLASHMDEVRRRHGEIVCSTEQTEAALKRRFTFEDISRRCTPVPPPGAAEPSKECIVEEFGRVGSRSDLRYQIYKVDPTREFPTFSTVVFNRHSSADEYEIAAWVDDEVNKPYIAYSDKMGEMLVLPGFPQGAAGRHFTDCAYKLEIPENIWRELEADRWEKDLEKRLSKQLRVNSKVSVDYTRSVATVLLMRHDDIMCCPTAGRAVIDLANKDRSVSMERFRIIPGAP